MKIAIVSLGCPKNQVDADVFCRALLAAGHTTVASVDEADAIIINTCGFIQSAKEEAIEEILNACAVKEARPDVKVLVTGCLSERYRHEVAAEIPEVDAVVGIGANAALPEILARVAAEEGNGHPLECYGEKSALPLGEKRVIGTPRHYAWLKIAEGCSNACSYCAIPQIRGPLRSRSVDSCVAEAKWLAAEGVKELVLVAQDVTAFGEDRGGNEIVPLLQELNKIEGLHWIRLLYAYPERITDALLDAMASCEKVLPYLDIPIQHIDDGILRSMRRRGDAACIRRALAKVRARLPGATLRTSLIVGYPGESEEQYEALYAFVKKARFDRLGCFAYSPEEGTTAAELPGQLPEEEKLRRVDGIMQLQARIMAEKQEALVGSRMEVICDGPDEEDGWYVCRTAADAPEIDANVLVEAEAPLETGGFYTVLVTGAQVYDLYAAYEGKMEDET